MQVLYLLLSTKEEEEDDDADRILLSHHTYETVFKDHSHRKGSVITLDLMKNEGRKERSCLVGPHI